MKILKPLVILLLLPIIIIVVLVYLVLALYTYIYTALELIIRTIFSTNHLSRTDLWDIYKKNFALIGIKVNMEEKK